VPVTNPSMGQAVDRRDGLSDYHRWIGRQFSCEDLALICHRLPYPGRGTEVKFEDELDHRFKTSNSRLHTQNMK
jgi:hypothetical protein